MRTSEHFNFVMFGVGGYVAERHLKVIKDLGHTLIGALDPSDSVGILDRYFPKCAFFTEPERFDRWLSMLEAGPWGDAAHWATVCSPNFLHDAHIRMALRAGCEVICEKPVVIEPWNVRQLQEAESKYDHGVWVVHQLRYHEDLVRLRRTETECPREKDRPALVDLTYCAPRGPWYRRSWKGDEERSGGILMNLGIHFLDAILWIYGPCYEHQVHLKTEDRMAGRIELENAVVRWYLSTNPRDCPDGKPNRRMTVDGREVFDFSRKFTDLHRRVYEASMSDLRCGVELEDALPAIQVAHDLRRSPMHRASDRDDEHPMLEEISI